MNDAAVVSHGCWDHYRFPDSDFCFLMMCWERSFPYDSRYYICGPPCSVYVVFYQKSFPCAKLTQVRVLFPPQVCFIHIAPIHTPQLSLLSFSFHPTLLFFFENSTICVWCPNWVVHLCGLLPLTVVVKKVFPGRVHLFFFSLSWHLLFPFFPSPFVSVLNF